MALVGSLGRGEHGYLGRASQLLSYDGHGEADLGGVWKEECATVYDGLLMTLTPTPTQAYSMTRKEGGLPN